jgi:hypothetical protein
MRTWGGLLSRRAFHNGEGGWAVAMSYVVLVLRKPKTFLLVAWCRCKFFLLRCLSGPSRSSSGPEKCEAEASAENNVSSVDMLMETLLLVEPPLHVADSITTPRFSNGLILQNTTYSKIRS